MSEQEREQLLTNYAFIRACTKLEQLTGIPSDDWEQEFINDGRNWLYAEIDQQVLDELSQEVEAA